MKVSFLVSLCGKIAPISSFALFLAPLVTLRKIARDENIGNFPLLPYSSMIVNCFIWAFYGVMTTQITVWLTNLIGLLFGTYYFFLFCYYCPSEVKSLPGNKFQHKLITTTIIISTLFITFTSLRETSIQLIGTIGTIFYLILLGSPLSKVRDVIRTKSAKCIPLPFTLASTSSSFLWSVFGIFEAKDIYIYAPSLVAFFLGLVQIGLIVKWGYVWSTKIEKPSEHNKHLA